MQAFFLNIDYLCYLYYPFETIDFFTIIIYIFKNLINIF